MVTQKRIFVAFAAEDTKYRDLLRGQAKNASTPIEFVDMSVKEPYDSAWKTKTRTRIKGSNGVIALLSRNSLSADGQLWEIECARDEGKPLLGVYVTKSDRTKPKEMGSARSIAWSWEGISSFIKSL